MKHLAAEHGAIPVQVALAITSLRRVVQHYHDEPLEDRLRAAMRASRTAEPWFLDPGDPEESDRLRAAVGAVLLETAGDEHARVERAAKWLVYGSVRLNALVAGVPIDAAEMQRELDEEWADRDSLINLRELWEATA